MVTDGHRSFRTRLDEPHRPHPLDIWWILMNGVAPEARLVEEWAECSLGVSAV